MKALFYPFLILTLLTTGCVKQNKGGAVLARFEGQTITTAEFKKKIANLPKEFRDAALRRKKDFVEEMVNERFLAREAKKRGVPNKPDVKELVDTAYQRIVIAKLIEEEVDKKITLEPDESMKYYESHKEEFMTPLLLRASHILVKTEAEALEVKKQLLAGADFEELARKKSLDNTAIRGGDVGFVQKGQSIPEFEEAAFKMKKGALSGVVKSQFGYHIIKLTDRAEPSLRDFKLIKNILEKQILNQKRARLFKEYVQKIRGGSKVEIDEKVLATV